MLNNHKKKSDLSIQEYNQYSKQLMLDNIGIIGQNKLKKSKVLIIGAGGLGCPIIIYLAASGIGNIGIIDHDNIGISNLNRQIIYHTNEIKKNKTYYSKQKIQKINPKCAISIYNYKLKYSNAINIMKYYDIIIDATDNFNTRYVIDEICYKLHKVHIYGAINRYEGQVSVFNYKNNIRYSDLYPKELQLIHQNCNEIGILGIMSGTIGILQATETIKIILGIGNILNGKILIYNLMNHAFKIIQISPYKKIIHKTTNTNQNQIPYIKINEIVKTNNTMIIDVQKNTDFINNHIKQSINIPLQLFIHKKTIQFISKQYQNKIIILYCNTLSKATTAAHILFNYNINSHILKS
uniref:Molybdopterin biosynthesis protein n=1 Tax=Antithamnionella ternifolia TaxID=207919 RepID=A0A4D6WJS8_9FLOR|nr:Molybdopterin biosynthesis protein [Antithamnionella ternifolia]